MLEYYPEGAAPIVRGESGQLKVQPMVTTLS